MIPLGISAANATAFNDTIAASHSINVTVQVLDLNHNRLADVSRFLLDGQVDVDATAEVTRTCNVSLLDTARSMHFDSNAPGDGALYLDRMIRVVYSVKVPGVGWVDCPMFTGPITKMDRQDDTIHLECQGKEVLAKGAAWSPLVFKKGHNRIHVLREILRQRAGETRFSLPESGSRLPKDFALDRESIPWAAAQTIATGLNMQLFYDGRGVCRLRSNPTSSTFHFKHGTGGHVLSEPQVTYSTDNLKNIVWVKGATPAGAKSPISVYKAAPRAHPLSPWRLGRTNSSGTLVPLYLLDVEDNSSIVSKSEATALAAQKLKDLLLEEVDVAFDSLPVPGVEPLDVCKVSTSEFSASFRLKQFSFPLSTGANMSVGYNVNVSPNRVALRRRR